MKLRKLSRKDAKKTVRRFKNTKRLKAFALILGSIACIMLGVKIGNAQRHSSGHGSYYPLETIQQKLRLNVISTANNTLTFSVNNILSDGVDYTKRIVSIELERDKETMTYNPETRTISGLLNNSSYVLRVIYTVPTDGGETVKTVSTQISTKRVNKPTAEISEYSVTPYSANATVTIPPSEYLISYTVELYDKSGELVCENADGKADFTDLLPMTNYIIKIVGTYDLHDGKGELTETLYTTTFRTPPVLSVESCEVIGSEMVSEGESLYINLNLDNPHGISVRSVVINGTSYTASESTDRSSAVIVIPNNGSDSGEMEFRIESINVKHNTTQYTIDVDDVSAHAIFAGKPKFTGIRLVNAELENAELINTSTQMYALISIENYTGCTVTGVTDSNGTEYTSITKLDDNRWLLPLTVEPEEGAHFITFSTLTYTIGGKARKVSIDAALAYYTQESLEPQYIRCAEDLLGMNGGSYYVLDADIDLSGISWQGGSFNGIFNGNHHKITGLTCVGAVEDQSAYLGLFSSAEGFIYDLVLEDVSIIVELKSVTPAYHEGYCGAIAGNADDLLIKNCYVGGSSIVKISSVDGCKVYAGGLVGGGNVTIYDSHNDAAVSSGYAAGGMIGCGSAVISGSSSYGKVSASGYIGELIAGGLLGDGTVVISGSHNLGEVEIFSNNTTTISYAGGLVGRGSGTVIDSYNGGVLNLEVYWDGYCGGIFGKTHGSVDIVHSHNEGAVTATVTNSYCYVGGLIGRAEGELKVRTSYNSAGLNYNNNSGKSSLVGGLVSEVSGCVAEFTDSYSSGVITVLVSTTYTTVKIGGIVGEAKSSSKVTLTRCYTACRIKTSEAVIMQMAGLVVFNTGSSTLSMNNCLTDCSYTYNAQSINVDALTFGTATIYNCYSTYTRFTTGQAHNCSISDMRRASFYTDTLRWSETVWDLPGLSGTNYPKLK